jgi:hypothetical protein
MQQTAVVLPWDSNHALLLLLLLLLSCSQLPTVCEGHGPVRVSLR